MKLFCSNAVTREDGVVVKQRMKRVVDALNTAGHDAYCPVFDSRQDELVAQGDVKAVMLLDFENIRSRDGVVVIVTSPRKSEGQLMEIGVALAARKPIYLFWHESAGDSSHLPKIATSVFRWQTDNDLQNVLAKL